MRPWSFFARVLLVAFSIPAGFASAATITSNDGFALDWNTPATWQGGAVPLAGDSVVIQPGSSVVIASADSVTVNAITVQGGTSASPSESGSLTIDGTPTDDLAAPLCEPGRGFFRISRSSLTSSDAPVAAAGARAGQSPKDRARSSSRRLARRRNRR